MQRLVKGTLYGLIVLGIISTTYYFNSNDGADNGGALYGGLISQQTESLEQVVKGKLLQFPEDHQPHPEFAIEWWYFTANLRANTASEQSYSLQYTLFRFNQGNKRANAWADGQMYMAHASLHTPEHHYFSERFARGGHKHVGVTNAPLTLRMDNWLWQANTDLLLPAALNLNMSSAERDVSMQFSLDASGPLILQGESGYSEKSSTGSHASYYYSQPFIQVEGMITENIDATADPVSVSGQGWFDHEWTSQLLDQQTLGWDWFSIHFDDGSKLMAFQMRLKDSTDFVTGTLIDRSGGSSVLKNGSITLTANDYEIDQESRIQYPVGWRLRISKSNIDLNISPQREKQWNDGRFRYYEGAITVSGTHTGEGFMELTGY